MKLSETWLREWVNPQATIEEIAQRLVMGGLELEVEPAVDTLPQGVVVGRIVAAEKHPQADRLQVCRVDVGAGEPLQIVCGAPNARVGLNAPCATVGSRLPGGMEITQAKLRGVDSSGMLCSAKELALSDKSDGLLELDATAAERAGIGSREQARRLAARTDGEDARGAREIGGAGRTLGTTARRPPPLRESPPKPGPHR